MGLQFKISLSWRITKLFIFMSQQIKTYQIHWQHGLNFPHLNKNQNKAKNSDLIGSGDTNESQRDTLEKAKGAELYIPVPQIPTRPGGLQDYGQFRNPAPTDLYNRNI